MCLVRQQNSLCFLSCVLPVLHRNKTMIHQEAQTNFSSPSRLQFQHRLAPVARNKVIKKQGEIASHSHVKFVTTGKCLIYQDSSSGLHLIWLSSFPPGICMGKRQEYEILVQMPQVWWGRWPVQYVPAFLCWIHYGLFFYGKKIN